MNYLCILVACLLYRGDAVRTDPVNNDTTIGYIEDSDCYEYYKQDSHRLYGGFRLELGLNITECQRVCSEEYGCRGVVVNTTDGNCYTTVDDTFTSLVMIEGIDTYSREKCVPGY